MNRKVAVALTLGVAAVSWAAVLVRFCDAPPLVIATWRVGLAGLVVLPLALAFHRPALRALTRAQRLWLLAAGIALGAHFGTWISSLTLTSVASSVAIVTTQPVWVVLISRVLLKERASTRALVAIAIALLGSVLIAGFDFGLTPRAVAGDALALAGAVCAAIYLVIGRRSGAQLPTAAYVGVVYPVAALTLAAATLLSGQSLIGDAHGLWAPKTLAMFVALALGPQLVGHSLLNWCLKHASARLVSTAILGEPVMATLLAIPLLGEVPTAGELTGGALVLGGVFLSVVAEPPQPRGKPEPDFAP